MTVGELIEWLHSGMAVLSAEGTGVDDETWAGGIDTGPPCSGCGKSPSRGSRWSFYCTLHGGACGDCKGKDGPIRCPVPHST